VKWTSDYARNDLDGIAEMYGWFADETRGSSSVYESFALGVARDVAVLSLLQRLPAGKRQPNLFFAAARFLGFKGEEFEEFRTWVFQNESSLIETMMTRRTQTNEVGRCATLLPALAQLQQPLALLEVGASAGLCLFPDRYAYDYDGRHVGDPAAPLRISCQTFGDVPLPAAIPKVVWRAGIDLEPVDVRSDEDVRWLESLVWPGQSERLVRLRSAVAFARQERPRVVAGDLNDRLRALASEVPPDATLVVFHSAVLAYLNEEDRRRFVATVTSLPGHWISNEGPTVVSDIALPSRATRAPHPSPFLLALDGRAIAWTGPHGDFIDWTAR